MPEQDPKPSANICKPPGRTGPAPEMCRNIFRPLSRMALGTCLACLLAALAPALATAADAPRPDVGEAYILNRVAEPLRPSSPGASLEQALQSSALDPAEIVDPSSRLWAGAQGLSLRLERAAALLDTDVIASAGASAGDGQAAAASTADGRIRLWGAGNCTSLQMPGAHPAYALALAKNGTVLAAWAQGMNRLVFFDLFAPGCPASSAETALRGQISLSLSASGAFLAAQDGEGKVWVGPRNGELRPVATLPGAPAVLGFSGAEGVLLVLDAQGRGGTWNPRTGKAMSTLKVPGGPFVRGEFHAGEARLWGANGRVVRWDVLHNRAVDNAVAIGPVEAPGQEGWLELRGTDLYYVRTHLSWQAEPLYEPGRLLLTLSRHASCLRLSDVDGQVRYFDARTGAARAQCFAEDWTAVAVHSDGTAQIPGLRLRIYDTLVQPRGRPGNYRINSRAISETEVFLWSDSPPDQTLRVPAPSTDAANAANPSQSVAELPARPTPEAVNIPLRQGLNADARSRLLRLH